MPERREFVPRATEESDALAQLTAPKRLLQITHFLPLVGTLYDG
jgi:hypothetical protein